MTVAMLASVIATILARRHLPSATFRGAEDAAAGVLGVLGTFLAVLIAFTVVMVWDHFTTATSAVESEATHIGVLSRLARSFDPADEQRIHARLVAYLSTVIHDEWPAMASGGDDVRAWNAIGDIWSAYRSVNLNDPSRQAIYAESLSHLSQVSDARRMRLHSLHDDVPGLMWLALVVGSLVVLIFTYLFVPERVAVHALLVGSVAALITLNLYLIYALDNPFRGWPRIGPDIMQQELTRMENAGR